MVSTSEVSLATCLFKESIISLPTVSLYSVVAFGNIQSTEWLIQKQSFQNQIRSLAYLPKSGPVQDVLTFMWMSSLVASGCYAWPDARRSFRPGIAGSRWKSSCISRASDPGPSAHIAPDLHLLTCKREHLLKNPAQQLKESARCVSCTQGGCDRRSWGCDGFSLGFSLLQRAACAPHIILLWKSNGFIVL